MKISLPPPETKFLSALGELAATFDAPAYLIGGAVRDRILGRPGAELDLMFERNTEEFLTFLMTKWPFPQVPKPIKVERFPKYLTGKLLFAESVFGSQTLDFSSARKETYSQPGSQPSAEKGILPDDLARRDFTVNALAASLRPDEFLEVLDQHGGLQDIEQRLLRTLHPASFKDDPMRIVRAIRFSVRLSFTIEQATETKMRETLASDVFRNVSPRRRFLELQKVFREEEAEKILGILVEERILEQVLPGARFEQGSISRIKSGDLAARYIAALSVHLEEKDLPTVLKSWALSGAEQAQVLELRGAR